MFVFGLQAVVFVVQFLVGYFRLLARLVLIDEEVANLFLRHQDVVIRLVLFVVGLQLVFTRLNFLRQLAGRNDDISQIEGCVLALEIFAHVVFRDAHAGGDESFELFTRNVISYAALKHWDVADAFLITAHVKLSRGVEQQKLSGRVAKGVGNPLLNFTFRCSQAQAPGFQDGHLFHNQAVQNLFVGVAHLHQAYLPAELAELLLNALFLGGEFAHGDLFTADGRQHFRAAGRLNLA